jgi:hypothetical protein
MLREMMEVVQQGEGNGNDMIIRLRLPSGLEILGLPTKNFTVVIGTLALLGITWSLQIVLFWWTRVEQDRGTSFLK